MKCKQLVTVTFDKIVNRKRRRLCTQCAREEGWFKAEGNGSEEQLKFDLP